MDIIIPLTHSSDFLRPHGRKAVEHTVGKGEKSWLPVAFSPFPTVLAALDQRKQLSFYHRSLRFYGEI